MPLRQWMLQITAYADRLAEDLALARLARGHAHHAAPTGSAAARAPRSTSASTATRTRRSRSSPRAPTRSWARPTSCSRPSTRSSPTLADAEHGARPSTRTSRRPRARATCDRIAARQDEDRRADRRRRPSTRSPAHACPIWVADYVIGGYGTGAVMAVPAHDERDFAFATRLRSSDRRGREPGRRRLHDALEAPRTSTTASPSAAASSTAWRRPSAQARDRRRSSRRSAAARGRSRYRLRDWVFSRQRYWGEPIPIYFPVELADPTGDPRRGRRAHDSLRPADRGRRVRAAAAPARARRLQARATIRPARSRASADWRFFQKDGQWFARETNTMPQWAGSCWYYLRFLDPKNDDEPWSTRSVRRVDARRPLRRRRRARRPAPPLRALLAQGALRPRPREGTPSRS